MNAGRTVKMGVLTCRLRLTRRSIQNDSLRAKVTDTNTDSVQPRHKACAVPRNFPVARRPPPLEQRGEEEEEE